LPGEKPGLDQGRKRLRHRNEPTCMGWSRLTSQRGGICPSAGVHARHRLGPHVGAWLDRPVGMRAGPTEGRPGTPSAAWQRGPEAAALRHPIRRQPLDVLCV